MPLSSGEPFGAGSWLPNLAALKAIDFDSNDPEGVWFMVGDGGVGFAPWVWKPAATNTPDDINIAQPTSIASGAGRLVRISVTDGLIRDRTLDDTHASAANTGTLSELFDWMAGRLKAITGQSSWLTAPAMTIAEIATALGAKLNSSAYTAADVLAKLLTVDGPSSAIDADMLDSQHGSYYAPIANAAFTGTSTTPTAALNTNTTQIANCLFVINQIAALVNSSPTALDTLNELAAALGNDANFATTITNALAGKEPAIASGSTSQYIRGDKTLATMNSSAVGLPNVTNHLQVNTTTAQTVAGDKTFSGVTRITNTTQATTTTNGALGTDGGFSCVGNAIIGGTLRLGGATSWGNHTFRAGTNSQFGVGNLPGWFGFAGGTTGVGFASINDGATAFLPLCFQGNPLYFFADQIILGTGQGSRLLPSSASGLAQGAIWCDTASGNVLKQVR